MNARTVTSRLLAVAGAVLAWLPVFAPLLLALAAMATGRGFLYDYLLPAEVFPLSLLAAALLLVAALLTQRKLWLVAVPLLAMIICFGLVSWIAQATGLADGTTQPGGWQETVVLGFLVLFTLAGVGLAVSGTILSRDVWRAAAGS